VTDRIEELISVYPENVLIRNVSHTCLKTSANERRQAYFEKINIFINYFSSFLVNDKFVFQEAYYSWSLIIYLNTECTKTHTIYDETNKYR